MFSKYLFFIISVISLKLAAGINVLYLDEEEEFSTKNIWKRYVNFGTDYDDDMRSNSQNEECSCSCRCYQTTPPQPKIIRFELPEWRLKPFVTQIQFGQPSNGQPQKGPFQGGLSLGSEFNLPQIGTSLGFGQPQEIPSGEQSPEGSIPQGDQPSSDIGDQSPNSEYPGSKGEQTSWTNSATGQNQTLPSTNSQLQGGLPQSNTSDNGQGSFPQSGIFVDSQGNLPEGSFSVGGQPQNGYDTIRIPENGGFQTTPFQWGSSYGYGKPKGGISINSDASLPQFELSMGNKGGQNQGGTSVKGEGSQSQNGLSLNGMFNNLGSSLSFGGQGSKSQNSGSANGYQGASGNGGLQGGESQEDKLAFGDFGNDKSDGQGNKSNEWRDQGGQSSARKSQGNSQSQNNNFGGNLDGGQLLDLNVLSPQLANNLQVG